ncbi:MAG: DUF3040 domain-containing protein [Frankiaceae bacterium]|nr:DUF3040 domain-containing protein [Frankiaceae bacterium]MBV9369111.1 DUF3040 domain-containing protein [Frankiales bacterium]
MPLSEHEQRLLEQIEQSLYAEDPKFARSWRTKDPGTVRRHTLVRAAVVFVVGLAALLAGVVLLNANTVAGIAVGTAGFLLMLGAAWYSLSTRQRVRAVAAPPAARPRGRGPRRSLSARLEERWERRQEDNGLR